MTHTQIENPKSCPLCGSSFFSPALERHLPPYTGNSAQPYTLYECRSCAVQFWWPMKNPGALWYSHDDRYSSRNSDPLMTPVITHRAFLKDNPIVGGSLLDVGCGTGNFLLAAKKKGYVVRGVDFDPDAVSVAKNIFGLDQVSTDSLKDIMRGGATFDIITFFEVLEHMDDPNAFIEEVKKLLCPGGFIGLSVPYRGSWNVFKAGDKPPRHLTRWDKTSMKNFLERNGFVAVKIKLIPVQFDFLITKFHFWTKGFLSFGLVNGVRGSALFKEVNGDSVKKEVNTSLIIRILKVSAKVKDYILFSIPSFFLYLYLIIMGRQYSGMYVLARKPLND